MLAVHLGAVGYAGEAEIRLAAIKKVANESPASDYSTVRKGTIYKRDLADDEEREAFLAPFRTLATNCASVAPIPPLDVAFCWALHRLSPKDYETDCEIVRKETRNDHRT